MQSRLSFQPPACASSSASTRPPGPCAHKLPIVIDEAAWENDAQWCNWKTSLHCFIGTLKVLELCGGSGAGYLALHKLLPIGALQLVGHWDTDSELRQIFNVIHGKSSAMHLGTVEGDILGGNIDRFPFAHIVIAGPPCPPWSKLGKKESFGDKRADVFWRVVDIVLHQANQGPLGLFVLENVESLKHKATAGIGESPLNTIMEKLRAGLPEGWVLAAHCCNSLNFGMPQRRGRVYIVGHRVDLFGTAPLAEPKKFERRLQLLTLLNQPSDIAIIAQPSDIAKYTVLQSENLIDWKLAYKEFMLNPIHEGSLAIVDISRTPSGRTTWGSISLHPDIAECLTASGPNLHIFSLGQGTDGLDIDRRLQGAERAALQGFPPCVCNIVGNTAKDRRIFGNAMTVSVVGAVLATELINLITTSSQENIATWLSHDSARSSTQWRNAFFHTFIDDAATDPTGPHPTQPTDACCMEMPDKRRRLDKDHKH
jgi:DNA-cytosine methyltransferase